MKDNEKEKKKTGKKISHLDRHKGKYKKKYSCLFLLTMFYFLARVMKCQLVKK